MTKDDLIDRQAAIDALNEQIEQCDKALSSFDISMRDGFAVKVERASLVAFRETLEYLPPAQPEPKRGRWIYKTDLVTAPTGYWECSECKEGRLLYEENFCPNCGADMRGEQDDSV